MFNIKIFVLFHNNAKQRHVLDAMSYFAKSLVKLILYKNHANKSPITSLQLCKNNEVVSKMSHNICHTNINMMSIKLFLVLDNFVTNY